MIFTGASSRIHRAFAAVCLRAVRVAKFTRDAVRVPISKGVRRRSGSELSHPASAILFDHNVAATKQ